MRMPTPGLSLVGFLPPQNALNYFRIACVPARKRAPGAGRPPRGDIANKVETFTTRITATTRRALEEAAKQHDRSLSQEAEIALRYYLEKPTGARHNQAIAKIVGILAESIEQKTGKNWRTDIFTSMALRYAVEAVLFHLAPGTEEKPDIPPAVEQRVAKMNEEFAVRYRRPAGLGHMTAYSFIEEIENRPRAGQMINEWTLPKGLSASLEMLDLLARDLKLE